MYERHVYDDERECNGRTYVRASQTRMANENVAVQGMYERHVYG